MDIALESANAGQFDALLLPGGVMNPDQLRMNPKAVEFVKRFADAGKPVAAICHGPWTLIEAGTVRGRTMTSGPSLKTDLKNAGAAWVNKEGVSDGPLVTSRQPDDIPAFNREMIRLFAQATEGPRRQPRQTLNENPDANSSSEQAGAGYLGNHLRRSVRWKRPHLKWTIVTFICRKKGRTMRAGGGVRGPGSPPLQTSVTLLYLS